MLVPAALKALVETALLVAAVVLVVAFSNDWDFPWLYWGVAAGLLPFAVMPRTFTVLSRAGVGTLIGGVCWWWSWRCWPCAAPWPGWSGPCSPAR